MDIELKMIDAIVPTAARSIKWANLAVKCVCARMEFLARIRMMLFQDAGAAQPTTHARIAATPT